MVRYVIIHIISEFLPKKILNSCLSCLRPVLQNILIGAYPRIRGYLRKARSLALDGRTLNLQVSKRGQRCGPVLSWKPAPGQVKETVSASIRGCSLRSGEINTEIYPYMSENIKINLINCVRLLASNR